MPLLVAVVVGGVGWYRLRRVTPGAKSEADEMFWTGQGRLAVPHGAGTSVLSEIVIGLGASLGREAVQSSAGGALFAAENLIGSVNVPVVLPAPACSDGAGVSQTTLVSRMTKPATRAGRTSLQRRIDCAALLDSVRAGRS